MSDVTVQGPGPVRTTGGRGAVVPEAEVRSYYGHPVIKPPVWTWEIPWYFFAGGTAGASSLLAALADATGNGPVARVARRTAAGAAVVSPALLISDLGRPARFLNMLRVLKVTSPMSVGSWLLAAFAPAAVAAAVLSELDRAPLLRRSAGWAAAALGPAMGTYTAALASNSAVPVWHEARHSLPFSFAGGAVASAGAMATAVLPPAQAATARHVAVTGAAFELAATATMERRLGSLGEPYHQGAAGSLGRAAKGLTVAGAAVVGSLGRRARPAVVAGSGMILAGQVLHRWSVFRAGFQSAEDPRYTVEPQRKRLEAQAGEEPGRGA